MALSICFYFILSRRFCFFVSSHIRSDWLLVFLGMNLIGQGYDMTYSVSILFLSTRSGSHQRRYQIYSRIAPCTYRTEVLDRTKQNVILLGLREIEKVCVCVCVGGGGNVAGAEGREEGGGEEE